MQPMYPGQVNSPQTELASAIDDEQTTIPLLDISKLPDPPNLATIGTGEDAETILYTGVSGNDLTGVTRGFQGAAKAWVQGTKVARNFTAYDYDALRQNVADHVAATTGVHGATSEATPNTIVQRDPAGRFKAAAPSASDDVARKAETDAALSAAQAAAQTATQTANELASHQADYAKQIAPIFNVKGYGAVGDGVADDTAAIIAARDAAISAGGGTIYFPAGKYLVTDTIEINLNHAWNLTGINIEGENPNVAAIICGVNGDHAFHIIGQHKTACSVKNLQFIGVDILSSKGLHLSFLSEEHLENLFFHNLFLGLEMEDCVRIKLVSCTFDQNRNGLVANNQVLESTPNAIDLFGCCFYGQAEMAAYFYGGCNINFFGGTVETNGHADTGSPRWGVKIENGGRYGGAIASFFGTFFEGNANVADVWIEHNEYAGTYSFHGCTFNKFAGHLKSPNRIRLDVQSNAEAMATLVVTGCSFRNYGLSPNPSEKYIQVNTGTTPVHFEQQGNYYQFREEMPDIYSNRIFASGRFVSLSSEPALYRGFNIKSIFKNGTGDYTITFKTPSVVDPRIKTGSIDGVGFVQLTDLTDTTMRVRVYDVDGTTLVDPSELSIIIME